MTKKKIATFTTVTDYQQEFEICLNDIWDKEKDINEFDEDELCDIAWDYILENPEKYRTCDPEYDNENILEQSITEED